MLHDALSQELVAFEHIPISEEDVEAIHSQTHRCLTTARASTVSWWSSTVRLEENIQLAEAEEMKLATALFCFALGFGTCP